MTATERAALIRGLYNALGMFAATFLTTLLASDDIRQALIIAGIAAFASLGFRAGVEGAYDSKRDKAGDVKPGDVTYEIPREQWGTEVMRREREAASGPTRINAP